MAKEENSKLNVNKTLYKSFLIVLKYIPIILALLVLLCNILSFCALNTVIINYIMYFLIYGYLYLISYVFDFCVYHRLCLHYIVINNLLAIIYIYTSIALFNILLISIITSGIFLILILYKYVKNNKKNTSKIDS